jgi:hypothetical protein
MNIHYGKEFSRVQRVFENFVDKDKALVNALQGMDFSLGLAKDPLFGVPIHAKFDPIFVGDSARICGKSCDAATEALLRLSPEKVRVRAKWDTAQNKYRMDFTGARDAAPDLIAGQLFSYWNVALFKRIFREPLSYSNIERLLRREDGDNPWADVITLLYEEYAGWAMNEETGSLKNQHTNDVNVLNGMMSAKVINLSVTYTLTIEEEERDKMRNGNPFAGQSIAQKQKYANYVNKFNQNYIEAYGNAETGTDGLLTVGPIQAYSGQSIKGIAKSTSVTTRGSLIYKTLAKEVNEFLAEADNKYTSVKIAVCPEVLNYLNSTPYSDDHNPKSASVIFAENYLVGKGPEGSTPSIEFISEPLFKPKSIFNGDPEDYVVMTAPEVGGGPDDEKMPLVLSAVPLEEFVYPAIPGMYNTQFKTLKRIAGVFAPVPKAVRVYKGLGIQSAD